MLKKVKHFFARQSVASNDKTLSNVQVKVSLAQNSSGYFIPQCADDLSHKPLRHQALQQLWEASSLPLDLYQRFYLAPLQTLLTFVQCVPASPAGQWSVVGGYGDLTIKFASCAVRLSKGHLLPPGATPEEQAAQNVVWNAVIFWAALFYHHELLTHLHGEMDNGEIWIPGLSLPERPFRFRFRTMPIARSVSRSLVTVQSIRLLPAGALEWVARVPAALDCFALLLNGQASSMPIIDTLLDAASLKVNSPLKSGDRSLQPAQPITNEPESTPVSSITINATSNLHLVADVVEQKTGNVTTVTLASALDNERQMESVQVVAQNETSVEKEDTQVLLSLFTDSPLREQVQPNESQEATEQVIQPTEEDTSQSDGNTLLSKGESFINWLSETLINHGIDVNRAESPVHLIDRYVFVAVPNIFFIYLKKTGVAEKRHIIQRAFERLGCHHLSQGERFIKAKIFHEVGASENYRVLTGYLIKKELIYQQQPIPKDSQLIALNASGL